MEKSSEKVLVVIKDEALRSKVQQHLKSESFIVVEAPQISDGLEAAGATECALLLIHLDHSADGYRDRLSALRVSKPNLCIIYILDSEDKEPFLPELSEMDEFLFKNELISSSLRLTHTVRRVRSMKNLYQHMQRHIDEFLSIFNCLDMGIYIVDPVNYSILAANSSAIKILGHNPVGKKCYEVLLKEQPGPCTHCDNELLARGILQYGSMPWEFKSSANEKWYRCISKILAWSENKFAKMEIIVDITDTKRMERELNLLRVFREKIRSLHHIPVMEFDKKGKIEYTNDACMEFLGLSKEDLADLFVWKFLDDHGKEAWFRLIDEVSMKDSESIECNLFTRERKVETYLNIIYNRDTKGTIIDGMLFIVEKPRKDFVRFY